MKSAFEQGLDYTFQNEGGFSNDAHDHGGPTKFGITIHDLSRWRKRSVSLQEVHDMKIDEAKAIYKAWYWDTMALDKVESAGVAIAMFDIGVVRGIGVPPKYAQMICAAHGNHLAIDGHIGPMTISAINLMDGATFIRDFSQMVENGFKAIVTRNSTQGKFLKGWTARARRLLTLIKVA